jgi:hypothetical protein
MVDAALFGEEEVVEYPYPSVYLETLRLHRAFGRHTPWHSPWSIRDGRLA